MHISFGINAFLAKNQCRFHLKMDFNKIKTF